MTNRSVLSQPKVNTGKAQIWSTSRSFVPQCSTLAIISMMSIKPCPDVLSSISSPSAFASRATISFRSNTQLLSNIQLLQQHSASELHNFQGILNIQLFTSHSFCNSYQQFTTCNQVSKSSSGISRRQRIKPQLIAIQAISDNNQGSTTMMSNYASEITCYPGLTRTWTSLSSWSLGVFHKGLLRRRSVESLPF